jgi:hypothetical protein
VQGKQEVTVAAGVFDLDIYPVPQGSQDARPTMGGYPVAFARTRGGWCDEGDFHGHFVWENIRPGLEANTCR